MNIINMFCKFPLHIFGGRFISCYYSLQDMNLNLLYVENQDLLYQVSNGDIKRENSFVLKKETSRFRNIRV
uniref:Uncharacterized protein n=1 Tax=Arundo donax TaxID=35708 RepID=A0A0A9DHA0_ARUDO